MIPLQIVVLSCIAAVSSTLRAQSPAPTFPIASPMEIGVGSHGSPNEAALLRSVGPVTRVTYYVQTPNGNPKDSPRERLLFRLRLEDLRAHGLDVLVVVHDFGADTVKTMTDLARSFPGTSWQVLNEADAWGYSGVQYARLMQTLVPAMRAADRSVRVVGMGLASTDGQRWARRPDATRQSTFLRDYLAAGGPLLDAWAIHVYGLPLEHVMRRNVAATQRVLQGRMPLWVTETGVDSTWLGRERVPASRMDSAQAAEAVGALAAARESGVARVYFYQLWTNDNLGFGFVRADAKTERPIMQRLRAVSGK